MGLMKSKNILQAVVKLRQIKLLPREQPPNPHQSRPKLLRKKKNLQIILVRLTTKPMLISTHFFLKPKHPLVIAKNATNPQIATSEEQRKNRLEQLRVRN